VDAHLTQPIASPAAAENAKNPTKYASSVASFTLTLFHNATTASGISKSR
jgi:hypothetical protein